MKAIKLLPILFLSASSLCAQSFELGSYANFSQPVGMMSSNMNNAIGLTLDASLLFKKPYALGLEMTFGTYGHEQSRQEYKFDDGTVTETDVNVNNNMASVFLTGKHFLRYNKKVNPYFRGKVGWTWFTTNLTIENPEDQTSCHPLESDILSRDNTYSFSGGAGVRIDFNSIFKNTEEGRFFFDISIQGTHGGIIKYMNVNMNPSSGAPDKDVMARFINTQTQVIHEHHVGYVYSSVLNMVDYRLGIVIKPPSR